MKKFIIDINDEDNDDGDIYDITNRKKPMYESIVYVISDKLFLKHSFINEENEDRFAVRTMM